MLLPDDGVQIEGKHLAVQTVDKMLLVWHDNFLVFLVLEHLSSGQLFKNHSENANKQTSKIWA
jgi:hypothetical protein